MSKKKWIKPGPMTGYPPGLLQDDDPQLSKWFASRPDARAIVRSVCNEIKESQMNDHTPECRKCGDQYPSQRWALGYKFCMPCGERLSKEVVRTVVPMHKSNYVMLTDMNDLKGINNKGGFYK